LGPAPSAVTPPSMLIQYDFHDERSNSPQVEIHRHYRSAQNTIIVEDAPIQDNHPLETWIDTNPKRLPQYNSSESNIFLRLQEESIPGTQEETEEFWLNPFFHFALPPPDDLPVD